MNYKNKRGGFYFFQLNHTGSNKKVNYFSYILINKQMKISFTFKYYNDENYKYWIFL